MTNVSFAVPTNYRVGSDPRAINQGRNPNDPNMITTGAYGSAFDLALQTATSSDGTTTDTLTYQSYNGDVRGSFSAVSDTGKGTDLASAYQSLLTSLKANGELSGEAPFAGCLRKTGREVPTWQYGHDRHLRRDDRPGGWPAPLRKS